MAVIYEEVYTVNPSKPVLAITPFSIISINSTAIYTNTKNDDMAMDLNSNCPC